MMTDRNPTYPCHYTRTVRALLRYALVLLVLGLLSGVAFQESAKKISFSDAPDGRHWQAVMHLALVHGHMIVAGVLLPVALAGMLHLARAHGGREIGPRALKWAVWTYLPGLSVTVALMLYKGYHVLLAARGGQTDLDLVHSTLFAGSKALRHGIYGLSHVGMGLGLCLFAWCLWRSLKVASR